MSETHVPPALIHLLPLAETWGVGDDVEREALVRRASINDLRQMVEAVDQAEEIGLFDWLSGDESYADPPSAEYVAITCLTMAADSGRLRLRRET
ncbi:MAG: hypothetical protein KY439_01185 [Actinobacteria bacterium]|nr:hypothetical protein [Actinomycetota bacterium]